MNALIKFSEGITQKIYELYLDGSCVMDNADNALDDYQPVVLMAFGRSGPISSEKKNIYYVRIEDVCLDGDMSAIEHILEKHNNLEKYKYPNSDIGNKHDNESSVKYQGLVYCNPSCAFIFPANEAPFVKGTEIEYPELKTNNEN